MKIKNIIFIQPVIQKLIQYSFKPMILNKNIVDFYKDIQTHFEFYETERVKLIKKLGERKENGDIIVSQINQEEFQKNINEILDIDIQINEKLTITDFNIYDADFCGDNIKQQLTPQDILTLMNFIEQQDK